MARTTGTDRTTPQQSAGVTLGEIADGQPAIEVVTDASRIDDVAAREEFMNEKVLIRLFEDGKEGTLQVETPNVNGINQPIVRGTPTWVKRKYVEVLARAKQQHYTQKQNPYDLADIEYVPRTTHYTGFEVIKDPNPRGRAWLDEILAQPA